MINVYSEIALFSSQVRLVKKSLTFKFINNSERLCVLCKSLVGKVKINDISCNQPYLYKWFHFYVLLLLKNVKFLNLFYRDILPYFLRFKAQELMTLLSEIVQKCDTRDGCEGSCCCWKFSWNSGGRNHFQKSKFFVWASTSSWPWVEDASLTSNKLNMIQEFKLELGLRMWIL